MSHAWSRRAFVVLTAAALSACGGHPQSFSEPGTMPMADRYSCAMQEINELGYTVVNADRDAGLIRAQKESSGIVSEVLSGNRTFRVLTVSIYDKRESGKTEMRVTAASAEESLLSGVFGGGRETGGEPDDETKAAARSLLEACTRAEAPARDEVESDTTASAGSVTYSSG